MNGEGFIRGRGLIRDLGLNREIRYIVSTFTQYILLIYLYTSII